MALGETEVRKNRFGAGLQRQRVRAYGLEDVACEPGGFVGSVREQLGEHYLPVGENRRFA